MSQETGELLGHGQPSGVPFGAAQHKKQGLLSTCEQEACVCRGHGVCAGSVGVQGLCVQTPCACIVCVCRVHVCTGSMHV